MRYLHIGIYVKISASYVKQWRLQSTNRQTNTQTHIYTHTHTHKQTYIQSKNWGNLFMPSSFFYIFCYRLKRWFPIYQMSYFVLEAEQFSCYIFWHIFESNTILTELRFYVRIFIVWKLIIYQLYYIYVKDVSNWLLSRTVINLRHDIFIQTYSILFMSREFEIQLFYKTATAWSTFA